MSALHLSLLGPPTLKIGDQRPVTHFRTRKTVALLAYLTLEARPHARQALARLLWPDSTDGTARSALRNTLAFLRGHLGDAAHRLRTDGDTVELRLEAADKLDCAFVLRAADPDSADVHLLTRELLEGVPVDPDDAFGAWLIDTRERVRRDAAALLARTAEHHRVSGDFMRAQDAARAWVTLEPHVEQAVLTLMRLHVQLGGSQAALHAFEAHEAHVRQAYGGRPSGVLQQLASTLRSAPVDQGVIREDAESASGFTTAPVQTFFGRDEELARLFSTFRQARREPSVALIDGEPGIGKTRLVDAFLDDASGKARILRGRAFEPTRSVPYQALSGVLRGALRFSRGEAPFDRAGLAELAVLLPDVLDVYPDLPTPSADPALANARRLAVIAELLLHAAREAPLVVFLDDVHWADPSTLDALSWLSTHEAFVGAPLLLLLTARSEALAEPDLRRWLSERTRAWRVTRLTLGPLARADGRAWLASLVTPGDLDVIEAWMHDRTGGQPLFITETLRTLHDERVLRNEGRARLTLNAAALARVEDTPQGVRDAVRARLARLGPTALKLVTAAGTLGRPVTLDLLAAVCAVSEDEALDAFEEVCARGVLAEQGDLVVFMHDRLREVAAEDVMGARRRALHRRALDLLRVSGESWAVLAWHAREAHAWTDAVRFDLAAGRQALTLAADAEAITHLERALAVLVQGPPGFDRAALTPGEVFDLFDRLNVAYDETDDRHPGRRSGLTRMRDEGRLTRDARLTVRALTELAVMHVWTPGEEDDAARCLDEAELLVTPGETRAWLHSARFYVAARYGDGEAQLSWARLALDEARVAGDEYLIGMCLANLSVALGGTEDWAAVTRAALDASTRLERVHNRVAAQRSAVTAAYGLWYLRDLEACARTARSAVVTSRDLRSGQFEVSAMRPLLSALTALGRLDELHELLPRFEELLLERDDEVFRALCLLDLAVALHALGRHHEARARYLEVEAAHARSPLPYFTEDAPSGLCDLALRRGDVEDAARWARLATLRRRDVRRPLAFGTLVSEVEALARHGDLDEASALVRMCSDVTPVVGDTLVWRFWTAAVLAEHEGRADTAERFARTYEAARHLERPLLAVRVAAQQALALRRFGREDDARLVACAAEEEVARLASTLPGEASVHVQRAYLPFEDRVRSGADRHPG
ncbi:ATP-binding protein [Deinococcus pimensis]|uniref:ATP-binding protein n=1 Tax=Deinococcus pimensis TaxID=309888 RepID=UPI0004805488|nr:AAA family ATPase [Deinococcus pimensis]